MNSITKVPGAVVYEGRSAVEVFRAKTLAVACSLYARTGMKVNRVYTPTAMLTTATAITGTVYKRGQHAKAAEDLRAWAEAQIGDTVKVS